VTVDIHAVEMLIMLAVTLAPSMSAMDTQCTLICATQTMLASAFL
jgi:hypothetical protein